MPDNEDIRRLLAACLIPLLDVTSLGEDDTPQKIQTLCVRVKDAAILPAAVCIYPEHVTTARRVLQDTPVKIATVVNFPDGGNDASRARRETQRAIAAGADEIDLVLPWAAFLRGDVATARAVVEAVRRTCGATHALKLILETGELATTEHIRAASQLGIDAGVDFLKTSTGKVPVNATPEAATTLLDTIAANRGRCGFKAAGGIRTLDAAVEYLDLARARLGEDWVAPEQFRIGASALYDELMFLLATPA